MADEPTTPDPSEKTSPALYSTDDLEAELAKREKKKDRNWKFAIGSALAAAITGWIPSVSNWIDAQAEKARREVLVEKVAKEQVANDEGYKKLAQTINLHTDDLKKLQSCQLEVEVLKEWRKGVDEKLQQRLAIRLPDPEPAEVAEKANIMIEPEPAAKKLSTKRPQPQADDPKLQQVKEDLKVKGL